MNKTCRAAMAAVSSLVLLGAAPPKVLVVCAPGSPGNTAQARPVMDSFASAAEREAGWPEGSLTAIYLEKAEPGLARLAQLDAVMALVPLPFYLQHGPALGLAPRLQVVRESGAGETWSLMAKKGAVASAAALAGWEIAGAPLYAPAFLRGPVLGGWGTLPVSTTVRFAPAILSFLRRAAAGEKVAVLLDAAQSAALPSLPFAGDLETVYRARPLPGTLLCTIGDRAKGPEFERLLKGLARLHEKPEGADILKAMQMIRFEPADLAGVEAARKAFADASATSR